MRPLSKIGPAVPALVLAGLAIVFIMAAVYINNEVEATKQLVASNLAARPVSCPTFQPQQQQQQQSAAFRASDPYALTPVVVRDWQSRTNPTVVVVPPPTASMDHRFWALRWSPDYKFDFLENAPDYTKWRRDEIEKLMSTIGWAHSVQLLPDLKSKGAFFGPDAWPNFWTAIPDNMHGKSFLDIGAWDGLWSFYAEERGARVHSVDYCCWGGNEYGSERPHGWKSDCCSGGDGTGYQLAHSLRRSNAKATRINVYDLHPDALGGKFDIVFFAGVLYHLEYPMLAIQRIASICNEMMILETHYEKAMTPDVAAWMYYPTNELNGDPSNWWGPNVKGLIGMVQASGFPRVVVHAEHLNRIILRAYKE